MHRRHVIELLDRYAAFWPGEREIAERFREFVAAHPDCLWRHGLPGHVTASAWLLSADGGQALLTHHRKLGRWLQLGGHVDGDPQLERACLREAREESGIAALALVPFGGDAVVPLDLDVHPIPARGAEPAHAHWDVRFLLRATRDEPLVCSDESHALRWFAPAELRQVTAEASVLRLADKAEAVLG